MASSLNCSKLFSSTSGPNILRTLKIYLDRYFDVCKSQHSSRVRRAGHCIIRVHFLEGFFFCCKSTSTQNFENNTFKQSIITTTRILATTKRTFRCKLRIYDKLK